VKLICKITGTRVHFVIFVIFIKIKYFNLLNAESPNFEIFNKFWYNAFFLYYNFKIEALKGKIFNFNENNENHKVYPSACVQNERSETPTISSNFSKLIKNKHMHGVGRVWIKWGKVGEFRQILKTKWFYLLSKGYTCVSKVRHLPPLRYGHDMCIWCVITHDTLHVRLNR
jgi:hypothetical protein